MVESRKVCQDIKAICDLTPIASRRGWQNTKAIIKTFYRQLTWEDVYIGLFYLCLIGVFFLAKTTYAKMEDTIYVAWSFNTKTGFLVSHLFGVFLLALSFMIVIEGFTEAMVSLGRFLVYLGRVVGIEILTVAAVSPQVGVLLVPVFGTLIGSVIAICITLVTGIWSGYKITFYTWAHIFPELEELSLKQTTDNVNHHAVDAPHESTDKN